MKKKPITTNTMIRSALRLLFLRSRERAKTLKDANYSCQKCGVKQTKKKGQEVFVEVHHLEPVNWDGLFEEIRRRLLHPPKKMIVLCKACHKLEEKKTEVDNGD